MKLKPITISVAKQKVMLLAAAIFVFFGEKFSLPGSQNFLNDILIDVGVDRVVSTATAYLAIVVGGLLLIMFFFERR